MPKQTKSDAGAAARKPRKRATKKASSAARLRVRQIRSGIGHAATYRRTLRALGLRHHQDEITVVDNPSVRGMIDKVRHLVRVTTEEA